jgi:hypothetical protein
MPIEARMAVKSGEVGCVFGFPRLQGGLIGHTANLASQMQPFAPTRSIAISERKLTS